MNKKVILMILDGWGKSNDPNVSAIDRANTPFIDNLYKKYPNGNLKTDGISVGLPDGQMGNSEVGHLNLGAGRIVPQELDKINKSIENKEFENNTIILDSFKYAKENNKNVHFIGLVSNGGVHSHKDHLYELIKLASKHNLKSYIHAFTDGRDVDPKSSYNDIKELENFIDDKNTFLASVTGRYYAMDRDNRWERTKLAYDAIINGEGIKTKDITKEIDSNYSNNCTDEFLKPLIKVNESSEPVGIIKKEDLVIFFNFRTDRGRQITQALSQKSFSKFETIDLNLYFVTMTNYDTTFSNIKVIYENENIKNTLGEVLENNNKKQLRISETEKYPHVTFFFSGGREKPFIGEKRILKDSPKVATYDLKPEMSAFLVTETLVKEIKDQSHDFICLNLANGDMVGHTGVMSAAIKACEAIDKCVKEIVNNSISNNYTVLLIADHGNCEIMINSDGTSNTAHTKNLVPIILIDKDLNHINDGILANIAPTILELMGVKIPKEMTEKSLLN
ncbi:MAG: 2,3-bisphosphoglycerate-independent phosphoglycerate mutase [Bacteroidota bacterium]|nr:2,3-bisphosphoglycerate-independent phosphoglycerate mutase [Bacteroidota bacterium]